MTVVYTARIDAILKLRVTHGPEIAYSGLSDLESRLIENHLQDPSTGTYRERASIILSGAEAWPGQHDYDAIRDGKPIEIKPKTWNPPKKSNADGHGAINEHSIARHEKFLKEEMIMQQSQFFSGYCGWIVEFPYEWMADHMVNQINNSKTRIRGTFTYKNWIDCPDLEVRWINKALIKEQRNNIVGGPFKNPKLLYKWLIDQEFKESVDLLC